MNSSYIYILLTLSVLVGSVLYWVFIGDKEEPAPIEVPTFKRLSISDKDFFWTVPNSSNVYIQLFDKNDKLITQYTISKYITLNPGQKVRIIAR